MVNTTRDAGAGDAIAIARGANREDDWQGMAPRTRTSILRAVARVIFGTDETPGLAEEFRGLKRWLVAGGSVGLALQIVSTFQLQQPLKHAVVLLFGGH